MSRYTEYLKRKQNASPFAEEANCRKCKHSEWVVSTAFCNGFKKPKRIPMEYYDTDKIGYCTQYYPRE